MRLIAINGYAEAELRRLFKNQLGNDPIGTRTIELDKIQAKWLDLSPGRYSLTWDNGNWDIEPT